MALERLAYVSRSTDPEEHLLAFSDILAQSVRNNRASRITGALTFTPGRYAQILEGDDQALDTLLQRISVDSRHCEMQILDRTPIQQRLFSEWSMIAPEFSSEGRARLEGMIEQDDLSMAELVDLILEMLLPVGDKQDPLAGSGLV